MCVTVSERVSVYGVCVCVCVCVRECVRACVRACMYVCMYVRACVLVYMYVRIRVLCLKIEQSALVITDISISLPTLQCTSYCKTLSQTTLVFHLSYPFTNKRDLKLQLKHPYSYQTPKPGVTFRQLLSSARSLPWPRGVYNNIARQPVLPKVHIPTTSRVRVTPAFRQPGHRFVIGSRLGKGYAG